MFMSIPISEIKETFSGDSYDTPGDAPRYVWDRILLKSRWYFYILFSSVVVQSSKLAKRGEYNDEAWIKSSFQLLRYLEGCGGRFQIKGLSHLRKSDKPLVIVGNHMSTLETIVLPSLIGTSRPLTFVVKERLVKGRVFGPVMQACNPIVVGRKDPREDLRVVMEKGKEILDTGRSLVIFPQSTRVRQFDPRQFNTLGVKLAIRAGVDILPVAIKTDFWGDSKIIKGFGPLYRERLIHLEFGEPIPIHGTGRDEHQCVIDFISSRIQQWRDGNNCQ